MARAKKLTKKMLETLDRGELRKIAILGMSMPPEEAYKRDMKGLVEWVFERPLELADVELNNIGKDHFRDGVANYVIELQGFIHGKNDPPPWPPMDLLPTAATVPDSIAPMREDPPPEDRVTTAYNNEQTTHREDVLEIEPPVAVENKSTGRKVRIALKKKKIGKQGKKAEATPQAVINAEEIEKRLSNFGDKFEKIYHDLDAITEVMPSANNIASLATSVDKINKDLQAVRQELADGNRLIANSILYLLNSVVQDDGDEFNDIASIPAPEEYLEEFDD